MLSIRLPKDIEKRLDKIAKATGRTKTFYVREAIIEHLDDLEDFYITHQRLKRRGKQFSISDVERGLDLEE